MRRRSGVRRRQVPEALRRRGRGSKLGRLRLLLLRPPLHRVVSAVVPRSVCRQHVEPASHGDARARGRGARSVSLALPSRPEQHRPRAPRRSDRTRRERDRLRLRSGSDQSAHAQREAQLHRLPTRRDGGRRARLRDLRLQDRRRVPYDQQRPRRRHVDVPVRWRGELRPLGDARIASERLGEGARGRQRLGEGPQRTPDHADLRG